MHQAKQMKAAAVASGPLSEKMAEKTKENKDTLNPGAGAAMVKNGSKNTTGKQFDALEPVSTTANNMASAKHPAGQATHGRATEHNVNVWLSNVESIEDLRELKDVDSLDEETFDHVSHRDAAGHEAAPNPIVTAAAKTGQHVAATMAKVTTHLLDTTVSLGNTAAFLKHAARRFMKPDNTRRNWTDAEGDAYLASSVVFRPSMPAHLLASGGSVCMMPDEIDIELMSFGVAADLNEDQDEYIGDTYCHVSGADCN